METLDQIRRAQRLVAYTGLAEKLLRPHPAAGGEAKGPNATVLGEIANLLKSRGIGELDEQVCLNLYKTNTHSTGPKIKDTKTQKKIEGPSV